MASYMIDPKTGERVLVHRTQPEQAQVSSQDETDESEDLTEKRRARSPSRKHQED